MTSLGALNGEEYLTLPLSYCSDKVCKKIFLTNWIGLSKTKSYLTPFGYMESIAPCNPTSHMMLKFIDKWLVHFIIPEFLTSRHLLFSQ